MDPEKGCAWYGTGCCDAANFAHEQIAMAADGQFVLQLGPVQAKRGAGKPRDYDCPHASECQWQLQAEEEGGICPPRTALRLGLDPRLAAW